jgi:hypothetical protein
MDSAKKNKVGKLNCAKSDTFKAKYFPRAYEMEKREQKIKEFGYGEYIADVILEGIKKDILALHIKS